MALGSVGLNVACWREFNPQQPLLQCLFDQALMHKLTQVLQVQPVPNVGRDKGKRKKRFEFQISQSHTSLSSPVSMLGHSLSRAGT